MVESSRGGKYIGEDYKIVWPPVVIIENTITGYDPVKKTQICLENGEVRQFLKNMKELEFDKVVALYGRNGPRGKTLVTFPTSPAGYTDAKILCQCLDEHQRGRVHWEKIRHGPRDGHGMATPDGKRILYGYLATYRDMEQLDYNHKIIKKWSIESYYEKIVLPLRHIEHQKEEATKKIVELSEEAKQRMCALEHNKSEFGKAKAELRKVSEEALHQRKEEEELEAMYKKNIEDRREKHEVERLRKLRELWSREEEIRGLLDKNKAEKMNELKRCEEAAKKLIKVISMEKKNLEMMRVEQKQIQAEAMDEVELNADLQLQIEEQLTSLEKRFREKELLLKKQHNEQIVELKEKIMAEKEELLQKQFQEMEALKVEVTVAKTNTQKKQEEAQSECIVCLGEFGEDLHERAFLKDCSHANICPACAEKLWKEARTKKKKMECPTCKTVQEKKFTVLPARFYT